ncbi:MAG: efflux RND transporter periplasmic adaptor subunit [Desulfobulbaceae bacterium]|nr:efflux RND transporter periplasmic adaptor subunit [Desulfobulbaceae bacterium]
MKDFFSINGKIIMLAGVLLPLFALFAYVTLRSGPLAPIPVTLMTVERREITPSLFGIGTVEARYTHKIGPTLTGRLKQVDVQPGDQVKTGQIVGEMDSVDLDDRINAQEAAFKRSEANIIAAEAQIQEASARKNFAGSQVKRYDQLLTVRSGSKEIAETKRQEFDITRAASSAAQANLEVSRQEVIRLRAERDGLVRQRASLRLVSPVDGFISRRDVDLGSTVVPGQSVVEVVEPSTIWINVRFDQQRAMGLRAQLPAQIVLRSHGTKPLAGQVVRVEPMADSVTEEVLAKVAFEQLPERRPSIGELAEVTVELVAQKLMPVVLNASLQRVDGHLGVWIVQDNHLSFSRVTIGASDLEGRVQILDGLDGGERIVSYSRKALQPKSRIKVVDRIIGQSP